MAPEVLAAIISSGTAAASAVGSGVAQSSLNKATREFNHHEARLQREWSEQMALQQNQWNLDLWNKENEYNTPAAQVQRLRDAGLNPLYYGLDGNSSANAFEAAQPLGYERASIGNQINPVSAGVDAASKVASIGNIQADTAKKMNENLSETVKREKMIEEINEIQQNIRNLQASEDLTVEQRKNLEKATSWLDRLNTAIVAEKESRAKLDKSQRKRIDVLLEGEKVLQAKSIEDFEHRWSKINAEIDKMAEETGLLKEDIENYALNHSQAGLFGSGLSIPNLIRSLIVGNKKMGVFIDSLEPSYSGVR